MFGRVITLAIEVHTHCVEFDEHPVIIGLTLDARIIKSRSLEIGSDAAHHICCR